LAAIVFCNQYPLPSHYFKNSTIPNLEQPFHCGQSVLLAHSQAYHLGKSIVGENSSIAYKNNGGYKIPLTNSSADAEAVQRSWDFNEGWFSEPIYLTGDYPATVKEYTSGFLRNFTDEEKKQILGSADYYAHDAYSAQFYMAPDTRSIRAAQIPPTPTLRKTVVGLSVPLQIQALRGYTRRQTGCLPSSGICKTLG
jgi:beta-glucosidase/6-phospho-beta-glucosidase/beta-galactosidase